MIENMIMIALLGMIVGAIWLIIKIHFLIKRSNTAIQKLEEEISTLEEYDESTT